MQSDVVQRAVQAISSMDFSAWFARTSPYTFDHPAILVAGISTYLVVLSSIVLFMRNRKPYQLKLPFAIESGFLSVFSFITLCGIVSSAMRSWIVDGASFEDLVCDQNGTVLPGMRIWIHLFYIAKHVEFLDSFFLALQKKDLAFLHVFHHASYIIPCWGASYGGFTSQWHLALLNTFIHTVMYGYYALSGYVPAVKKIAKYITSMQMIQFLLGNFGLGLAFWYYVAHGRHCSGHPWIASSSNLFTGIYFALFAKMYIQRYIRGTSKKSDAAAQKASDADKKAQ
ncbi:putative steroid isomerase [Paratrimastix pyriformis]|uniref:Elongation of fatty acids protein n=1 Tax=Paratrimastix pyriformis TaxID=342808 RepID=A0ABQ8UQA1_9EUKA|nr:putative steroid isomerase [Paratrimastix pyriformis]